MHLQIKNQWKCTFKKTVTNNCIFCTKKKQLLFCEKSKSDSFDAIVFQHPKILKNIVWRDTHRRNFHIFPMLFQFFQRICFHKKKKKKLNNNMNKRNYIQNIYEKSTCVQTNLTLAQLWLTHVLYKNQIKINKKILNASKIYKTKFYWKCCGAKKNCCGAKWAMAGCHQQFSGVQKRSPGVCTYLYVCVLVLSAVCYWFELLFV